MSKGRRYNSKSKLNIKKVIATIAIIAVIIVFIIAVKNLLQSDSSSSKLVSTTYFLVNKNNKWGVIDNNSKIIIEPVYNSAIIIPNNKKDVFITTYEEDYSNDTYKTKVFNSKNKEIFTQYELVKSIENYDSNKNLWYEENVLAIKKNGKFGLINFEGEEILSPSFDDIYALNGIEGSIITVKNKKLGLVNNLGQEIIENKYQEIKTLGEDTKNYIVKENDKYGIYNIIDCKYQEIKALNNKDIYCVKEDNKYKIIDKDEEVIFNEKFDNIETIAENTIVYKYNNQYCAYNIQTNKKLNKFYKELKYTSNDMFIYKLDSNYGILNLNNEVKIADKYVIINYYDNAQIYELEQKDTDENTILNSKLSQIAKGVVNDTNSEKSYIKLWTKEGYKYYNFNGEEKDIKDVFANNNLFLSKQNNKYGFIDEQGNVILDYIYDDAIQQNEFGYISVKKDGLWGSIDKTGKVVCQTKYNLDNNLLIDFIGEYYLGKDLNLMYYTDK